MGLSTFVPVAYVVPDTQLVGAGNTLPLTVVSGMDYSVRVGSFEVLSW
jgi:hypothetical protein